MIATLTTDERLDSDESLDEANWLGDMPAQWPLESPEDMAMAFRFFPYGAYPLDEARRLVRDIQALMPATVMDPMFHLHARTAAQVLLNQLLLRALDGRLLALPSLSLEFMFASLGLTVSYDNRCLREPRLALQPGFWLSKAQSLPINITVAYAPGRLPDLLLPLARHFTLQVVCLLVSPDYIHNASPWRQGMLEELQENRVLHVCPVWDDQQHCIGVWLSAFSNPQVRSRLLMPGILPAASTNHIYIPQTPEGSPSSEQ